jgi:hypothetical protein
MLTVEERLDKWTYYEPNTGCWLWTGARDANGYGRIAVGNGRWRSAHRVTYELAVGPVPAGLELDHLCQQRACRSPYHLEPVTHRENMRRGNGPMARKARQTHCLHGHPLTGANLRIRQAGLRQCRTCERAALERLHAAEKGASRV